MSQHSYRQTLKTTGLVGGSHVVSLVIGMIRIKCLAYLLGTTGVGIAGMYQSALAMIGAIAGLGIDRSGVRQIAEAVGSGDRKRISRTAKTLRYTSLGAGILGMLTALFLCYPLSRLTFGDESHAGGIAIVSIALFFMAVSNGQFALLQGLRRIRDLAKCKMWGAGAGAGVSVLLVWIFGESGIVWYVVVAWAFSILFSWFYARRVKIEPVRMTWPELRAEARGLLGLGVPMMIGGLMGPLATYWGRVLVRQVYGMDAVGLYTASITLSIVYVGIVLQAMGADYYPLLTSVICDNKSVRRLINVQTVVGLLFVTPGVIATLTFAPWVLELLYSEEFVPATELIRWQVMGVVLQTVSWPMGYVQLAKGMGKLFVVTEISFSALRVLLIYCSMGLWGLSGAGVAHVLIYGIYIMGMWMICRRLCEFSWSRQAIIVISIALGAIGGVFGFLNTLSVFWGTLWGSGATLVSLFVCIYYLQKFANINIIKSIYSKLHANEVSNE